MKDLAKGIEEILSNYYIASNITVKEIAQQIAESIVVDWEKIVDIMIENADDESRIWFSDTAKAIASSDILKVKETNKNLVTCPYCEEKVDKLFGGRCKRCCY